MGQESDDIVSLPAPPPPNPAARRSAIDTALRKFDGIEEPAKSRARPGLLGWASSHRRATGGLVTAALIAVVGIPAMQVALRDRANEAASEQAGPAPVTADIESVQGRAATEDTPRAEPPPPVPIARKEPATAAAEQPNLANEEKHLGFSDFEPAQKARSANIVPAISAPASPVASAAPPPPPPPAASRAQGQVADSVAPQSDNITVTGTLIRNPNMESAGPISVVAEENASADFQAKLRSAFHANNRKAILALVGYPLQVSFNGDVSTYRSRSEVERDFDRIFTADVRGSVLNGQASRHMSFAPSPPGSAVKIRAVRP